MVVTDERDGNNMDEVVSAVNTAFASPCSSISSKKSCEDKVPGSIQGDKNHSNSVAKSSEMSSGTEVSCIRSPFIVPLLFYHTFHTFSPIFHDEKEL